jgi:hypothetical protein
MVVTFFKEETRLRRLQALIDNSNAKQRFGLAVSGSKKAR